MMILMTKNITIGTAENQLGNNEVNFDVNFTGNKAIKCCFAD